MIVAVDGQVHLGNRQVACKLHLSDARQCRHGAVQTHSSLRRHRILHNLPEHKVISLLKNKLAIATAHKSTLSVSNRVPISLSSCFATLAFLRLFACKSSLIVQCVVAKLRRKHLPRAYHTHRSCAATASTAVFERTAQLCRGKRIFQLQCIGTRDEDVRALKRLTSASPRVEGLALIRGAVACAAVHRQAPGVRGVVCWHPRVQHDRAVS